MDVVYIDKCLYEKQEQKKFRYGIPAYTAPSQALVFKHWCSILYFNTWIVKNVDDHGDYASLITMDLIT
jgi:hypothetical protein